MTTDSNIASELVVWIEAGLRHWDIAGVRDGPARQPASAVRYLAKLDNLALVRSQVLKSPRTHESADGGLNSILCNCGDD
jgi:hypothetical protein